MKNLVFNLRTAKAQAEGCAKVSRMAKILTTLTLLLSLCVGQMWGGTGFYEVYMVYDKNGSENNYTYNGSNGSMDLGTITSSFKIKKMYLKVWDDWGDQAFDAGQSGLGYKTQSGSDTDFKTNTRSSESAHDYELQHTNMNLTIASSTDPSGNYTFEHWWFAAGTWEAAHYLKNSGNNCEFTYKILPPAVKSSSIAISATNTAPGSGTGLSSGSPIILISGMASTLTITATQNHTDANSALWCKFGGNSYSSTTTYNIASGTTTSNQAIALKVKYRNNSASLDGAETTTTIYYKWAAPAPAIVLTSVTPSTSIVAGNDITLVGTRANSSNTISFQYTTNNGSTWTDITPKTSSLSSNVLTATWTVPDAHGANQTFKFRAKLAEATPIYSSKSDGVTVYNTKTIHVKNSNNWSSMYVYAWDGSGDITKSWYGNTGSDNNGGFRCSNTGGQWWDVVITSQATGFILNGGVNGDANKTNDLAYSTYTHDRCLAIGTESGKKSLSSTAATCPSAPSVTTASATSIGTTSVKFNASSVSANNDAITAYGFKWGTTSACNGGTVTASNLSSTTFSATKSSLTNGTTYYFKAYATNGQGTTYGDPVSVRTKFITTVTLNQQGGEDGTTEVTATEGSSMPTGKVAPTKWGYDFGGYYASAGGSGTKYYNANMSSAHNWDVAASTATIHAYWTAKSCTITLNNQGADSGKEGTTSQTTTYNTSTGLSTIICPTKTGWKFQGYWTNTNGNGKQIISSTGNWNSDVTIYMNDGKWVYDGGITLYAYWVKASTYTFRYGTSGSEDWASADFTQVGATTTWQIENFTIPNKTHFFVGYEGLFYESGLGTGATKSKSVTRAWANAPSAVSETYQGQMVLLPAGPGAGAIGQATGAQGTLKIYSDSKHHNLYVGFEPSGYGVTRASGTLAFVNSSGTWRETNVVTLNSSDASGNFQVKLKTSSSYVATAHGTAENASAVNGRKITGDADIANGKKGVFQMWTDATSNNFGLRFVTVHDVTFNMQGHGSAISKYSDVRYNNKISAPSAPSATGYTFGGWYKEEGCTNAWDFDNDVITAATTLYAKWTAKTYTVTLTNSGTGYGSGGQANLTATYDAAFPSAAMPTAANGYAFMGYWSAANGTGTQFTDASGNLLANITDYSDASGHWKYDASDLTLYAYYKKAEITAITLNNTMFDPVAAGGTGFVIANPTIAPTPVLPVKICWELLYDNDNPVPAGHEAIDDHDGSHPDRVKFSIAGLAAGGYKIKATLRTGDDCSGGTLLSEREVSFTIASGYTVTIQYKDTEGNTIAPSTTSPGKATDWTAVSAPTIVGYNFSTWVPGDGITLESSATTNSNRFKATFNGTLTARYTKKRVIYFNNTLGWSNVYVYFYSGEYWDGNNGTGSQTGGTYTGTHGQMQPVSEGSKIYYFDAEGASVNASYTYVAFTELEQTDYKNFAKTNSVKNKVAYRGDYNSTKLPMFVPLADQTPVSKNSNLADYYNEGYWMNYPENTGYALRLFNSSGVEIDSIPFEFTPDKTMPMSVEYILDGSKTYQFKLYRTDGKWFGNNGTMKAGASGDIGETSWEFKEKDGETTRNNCQIKTNAAGTYTFTLDFGDKGGYNYLIGVHYPAAANDFQILYNDNAEWSLGSAHDANWVHPSRIIRARENGVDTISFFVAKDNAPILKARKVSSINASTGAITWESLNINGAATQSLSVDSSAVYNFKVTQGAAGVINSIQYIGAYTGNYYIRSSALSNKWGNYVDNLDHRMTYSSFSESAANSFGEKYSHYKAKWCPRNTNIAFCIANDYSPCITDTLIQDVGNPYNNTDTEGTLKNDGNNGHSGSQAYLDPYSANVRFMWNRKTNKISRAYVSASTSTNAEFLVLQGSGTANANIYNGSTGAAFTANPPGKNSVILSDNENWIYEVTVKANPSALVKLYANYCGKTQWFRGAAGGFAEGTTAIQILGGSASASQYSVRVIYDFKTNRLIAAWVPSGSSETIDTDLTVNADVMIVREHQESAQCITFSNDAKMTSVKNVYGVMRFNRWILNNRQHPEDQDKEHARPDHIVEDLAEHHPPLSVGQQKSTYERRLYFISFPFDVLVGDIFGFGTYGQYWVIQYYDGLNRAKNGYWMDSKPNWKYVSPSKVAQGYKLEKNQGYILELNLSAMAADNTTFWSNGISTIELYFPSTVNQDILKQTNCTIPALSDEYECTINRGTEEGDRRVKDSYWRCIGVPSYNLYNSTLKDGSGNDITWKTDYTWHNDECEFPFIYMWNKTDNTLTPQATSTFTFQPMHAYLTQIKNAIVWTAVSAKPSSIVARRARKEATKEYNWRIELKQDTTFLDQTYVRMTDLEQVTDNFDFGQDLIKELNSRSNIYTFIGYEKVAANSMTLHTDQTTVIPVGANITTEGDYTFALPDGADGIGVTLIDEETGVRTNLSAGMDYTVYLEKGTHDNRFWLEISPVQQTPTDIEAVSGQPSEVRKVLIDGLLYIVKDGKLFDARGARLR